MPIGPTLPPTAEKRKREGDQDSNSDSEDSLGPQPQQDIDEPSVAKKTRVAGPSLPPPSSTPNPKEAEKDETSDEDSNTDDDDFGPAPPTEADTSTSQAEHQASIVASNSHVSGTASVAPTQRDEWMTLAPTGGDWSQRVDPTKLKNRKFNTGKSMSSARGTSDTWNETPAEKQARLQREVLGIKDSKKASSVEKSATPSQQDEETVRRMKEYNAQRGPSLYEAHQKGQKVEKDDDPSARAFDREKDIGGGLQINSTQRKEMMKRSSDFNSRFSNAKYL